jgi:hypothetical protein
MDPRKIIIVSTKTQKRTVIESAATTLAELKSDLKSAGIDYSGMTFYEGLSKIELKTDESLLPHDVPYKGTVTNELVFMLTNVNKKIDSGSLTRQEVYSKIKEYRLEKEVKNLYGKNFTQVSTSDLVKLIDNEERNTECNTAEVKPEITETEDVASFEYNVKVSLVRIATILAAIIACEKNSGDIDDAEYQSLVSQIKEINKNLDNLKVSSKKEESKELCSPYSCDEIDDMFKDMIE